MRYTVTIEDPAGYCESAKHYDFTWFEMQHSTLEFKDIEAMIAACPKIAAKPMIRRPDAQEWHIQHTTDIGALGVIVPTVDDVDRARSRKMGSISTCRPRTAECRPSAAISRHPCTSEHLPSRVRNKAVTPSVRVIAIACDLQARTNGVRAQTFQSSAVQEYLQSAPVHGILRRLVPGP